MTIGELIRTKRKELDMTQDDLARAVNTTKATVSRWESGDIDKMKESFIKDLARVLQLDEFLFVQPHEVLMPDEAQLLAAYRSAQDWKKNAVRKLLDIQENNEE